MMLYTKYESSGPCSVGQEEFWKLHFKTYFYTQWLIYATKWNGLNNFGRGIVPVKLGQIQSVVSGEKSFEWKSKPVTWALSHFNFACYIVREQTNASLVA